MGMATIAAMASTFSDTEIGSPIVRSSATKAARVGPGGPCSRPDTSALRGQLGRRLLDVRLVLEQDMERINGKLGSDLLGPEQEQRIGEVDGLGHRRPLFEFDRPKGPHPAPLWRA